MTSRSRVATVRSASILRSTTISSASRVCSSTMLSSLSTLASAVWSNSENALCSGWVSVTRGRTNPSMVSGFRAVHPSGQGNHRRCGGEG